LVNWSIPGFQRRIIAHLRRARENGVTRTDLGALIIRLAFYAGFPAIAEAVIANATLGQGG
jgi:4-carboxymuconolactone decarboxylase